MRKKPLQQKFLETSRPTTIPEGTARYEVGRPTTAMSSSSTSYLPTEAATKAPPDPLEAAHARVPFQEP